MHVLALGLFLLVAFVHSNSVHGGSGGGSIPNKEKQQLLAELDERKRRILREVEVRIALWSCGGEDGFVVLWR